MDSWERVLQKGSKATATLWFNTVAAEVASRKPAICLRTSAATVIATTYEHESSFSFSYSAFFEDEHEDDDEDGSIRAKIEERHILSLFLSAAPRLGGCLNCRF